MKKLMLTALTILSCGAAYALPVGNPADASLYTNGVWWGTDSSCCDPCGSWCDMFSLRLGFYGDYVFNRHMEISNNQSKGDDVSDTELYTNAGLIVLNFCNWLDVFGTVGTTDISVLANGGSFAGGEGATASLVQFDFETDFSWSVGARATIWHCNCFAVGVEGQYFQTTPNVDSMIRYETGEIRYFNTNNGTTYSEWQVGFGASYRYTTGCVAFVPYMAVKWANGKFDLTDFSYAFPDVTVGSGAYRYRDMEPSKSWGYAVGMTATVCDTVGVTVEGRFADEKALYVNGQFRF